MKIDIDKILKLDEERRELIQEVEKLKAEKNKLGKGDQEKAKKIKIEIKKFEPKLGKTDKEFNELMLQVHIPLDDLKSNKAIKKEGKAVKGGKNYLEIAEKLDIIDVQVCARLEEAQVSADASCPGDLVHITGPLGWYPR